MLSLLLDVGPPPREIFSLRLVVTVVIVAIIVYPVQKVVRRAISERRKQRWAREESTSPPEHLPEPDDPRDLPS